MTGKNKNKLLIILIIVLAVICVLYIGISRYTAARTSREESEAAAESEASRIWVTEMEDVSAVHLAGAETDLTFVKEDDVWYYDDDRNFPVNQDTLTSLAEDAGHLEATRAITDADALADYGLESPQTKITVTDSAGKSVDLLLGNAYNSENYLKRADNDTVYTVSSSLAGAAADKALYDFVEVETLPDIYPEKIQTMEIAANGVSYKLERNKAETTAADGETAASGSEAEVSDGTEPEAAESGSSGETDAKTQETWTYSIDGAVQESDNGIGLSMASALAGVRISGCVDYKAEGGEAAAYGLDAPSVQIKCSFEDDAGTENLTINIGNQTEDGASYYVMTEGHEAVNTISADSIKGILGYVGI